MAKRHRQGPRPRGPRQHGGGNQAAPDFAQQAGARAARLAVDHLNRGDQRSAATIIEQGLRHAPEYPDLLHLAGQLALTKGDAAAGRRLIERAVARAPGVALFHLSLGNICFVDGDINGALKHFRRALKCNPGYVDAHTNIGIALARKGQQEEAEAAFVNAAKLNPDDARSHLNLAVCNLQLRRPDKVVAAVGRVEELVAEPDSALLHEIGNIYRGLGRHLVAEDYYRRALRRNPEAADIWFALGDVLSQAGEHKAAAESLDQAAAHGYPAASLKLARARVAANRGDIVGAKRLLADAFDAAGDNAGFIIRIAKESSLIGDFAAQEKYLKRALELDPDNITAFASLVFAPGRPLEESDARRLRSLAEDQTVDLEARVTIGFALGNHFRHAGRYDESFRFYRLGNRLKGFSFDRAAYEHWVARMETLFTPAFFAERTDWGADSKMPVLIVGMPRSGTTLTEQILSSHQAVFGAGEFGTVAALAAVEQRAVPDFRVRPELAEALSRQDVAAHAEAYLGRMRALAAHGEGHVCNKLPHNFQHLGLFGLLFPGAPVIHVKRDPRDNLLSIYFQDFAGFHDYAYDLKSLGQYYRLYERLTAHWLDVIPNPVYSLQYEDLVADLPGRSREMAAFLGIDWDERMLRFHEHDRKVETASKWQVRQPLYKTSVARWRPYEKHLKPLFEALGIPG